MNEFEVRKKHKKQVFLEPSSHKDTDKLNCRARFPTIYCKRYMKYPSLLLQYLHKLY